MTREICVTWGLVETYDPPHASCAVIGPGPKVCTCECSTCKRLWFERKRPMLRDGKIIFEEGFGR